MGIIAPNAPMLQALQHMESEFPNEGVGVFLNPGEGKDEFVPLPNRTQRDPKHNFEIDPIELIEAVDRWAVRKRVPVPDLLRLLAGATFVPEPDEDGLCGPRIVSLVHSHPSGRVGPSEADLEALKAMSRFGTSRGWVISRGCLDGKRWVTGALSCFGISGEHVRYEGDFR